MIEFKHRIITKSVIRGLLFSLVNILIGLLHYSRYFSQYFYIFLIIAIVLKLLLLNVFDKKLNYNSFSKYFVTDLISTVISLAIFWTTMWYIDSLISKPINNSPDYSIVTVYIINFISFIITSIGSIFTNIKYVKMYDESKIKIIRTI